MADNAHPLPDHVGRYELHEPLGAGASGTVYRAFDPFVGRDVAIKLGRPEDASRAADPEWQQAYFAEARAAGRLDHPHIVGVYDAGVDLPWCYIVMEYIAGHDLSRWGYRSDERLPVHEVVDIVYRCCKALDYAHRHGVIHRDIKPGNILLANNRQARITDFSIARMHAGNDAPATGITHGTPAYMAPEQIRGRDTGPATDLYALGVVLFELLTGRRPFEHPDVRMLSRLILQAPTPAMEEINPSAPGELEDVVARALAKEPAERFHSGAEFALALGEAMQEFTRSGRGVDRARQEGLLGRVESFASFTPEQVDALLETGTMVEFRKGDPLIREGEIDQQLYILIQGSARVMKGEVELETLTGGDCFGEMAFLAETRRSADVIADDNGVILKVSKEVLEQAPQETQRLYFRTFCTMLIHRLASTSNRLAEILQQRGGRE